MNNPPENIAFNIHHSIDVKIEDLSWSISALDNVTVSSTLEYLSLHLEPLLLYQALAWCNLSKYLKISIVYLVKLAKSVQITQTESQ